ncbi:SusC/RagA family TonB-linked outer membrane protein [Phocaeicola sp.]
MLKRLKSVSMMLFLMGTSTGAAYAVTDPGVTDVQITQQSGTCTGVVIDATGETVIGASVVVKGTTNGTITGFDGDFSLSNVKKGDIIQISFVGYITKEIKFNGQPLKITLQEDSQTLGEVVVTGYGGIQKAKTMTASTSIVKMSEIAKLPVTSISEGLGGRVTGVVTQQSSGAPGETAKIWVRGGSQVLYVIDDVVMETAQGEIFFNRLRPEDIASMAILKDASATAIYGPRANDGVVVIQTKRGQDGAPEIVVGQKVSIMMPSYRAKSMSTYDFAKTRNELAWANGAASPYYNDVQMSKFYMGDLWQKGYSINDIAGMSGDINQMFGQSYSTMDIMDLFSPSKSPSTGWMNGGNIQDYYSYYDPWDMFNHTQPMYQTNLSIRGGSERIKYYSSLSYLNQKGISDTFNYEQVNAILNTDAFLLNDKSLRFTLNINANTATKKQPAAGESVFRDAMYGQPFGFRPAVWSNGKAKQGSVDALLNTGFNNTDDYRIQLNAGLKWNLPWVPGLAVSTSVNYNNSYTTNKAFEHDQTEVYGSPVSTDFSSYNANNAKVSQSWSNYKLLTGIFQVDYSHSFGKHNLAAMANYQSQIRRTNNTNAKAYGYPTTLTPQISLGTSIDTGGTGGNATDWGSASWIGRVTYDYDGKYMFQYSANYNASLSYSPSKRWGLFQAASAGWLVSEEEWFKNLIDRKIISSFKIRGGYGIVGGEIGNPFDYVNQYAQNGTRVLFGDMTPNVAWNESKLASDLTWSKSRQMSAGIDFGLLNDRLAGSLDVYLYKNNGASMDMNQDIIRTDIIGAPNTPQINAPFETSRKGGYEISLNWNDKIGKVAYRIGGNFSYWDERVTRHTTKDTDWYYPHLDLIGHRNMHGTYPLAYQTYDKLVGSWEQLYNSVFTHNSRYNHLGNYMIKDLNGDGVINYADFAVTDAPSTVPLTQYGITLGVNWNGFDAEIFFQGAMNVSGTVPSPIRGADAEYLWNYGQYVYQNSYLPSNPDVEAALPMPSTVNSSFGGTSVDWWAFDASYLKLKNISVRYDFKHKLLKNLNTVKGLEASFVVTNAFTWTKKSYPLKGLQDPEFITSGGNMYQSNGTLGSYPTQRSFTFSLTVTL